MQKLISFRWLLVTLAFIATVTAGEDRRPEPIVMTEPAYPYLLARKGISGRVLVEFTIGRDGHVLQAKALKSTNEGFEQAAVDAVLRWRFSPGLKDGKAVNVRAQQELSFDLPKHRLIYPFAMLKEGINGSATVGFWTDESGRLVRSEVLEATDPIFGKAAEAMIADELSNNPPRSDRAPKGMSRTTYTFRSNGSGQAEVSRSAREILKMLKKQGGQFSEPGELDHPMIPIAQPPPVFPVALREKQPNGTAVIEFFVDRKGQVQLPQVVSATSEDFGYAAAQAVGQWSYKPPLKQDSGVIVRMRIPVEFAREPSK